tara:strand:- start:1786 stop:2616 length:831 start_codon:yes stop_codon:yes gene_type:complete
MAETKVNTRDQKHLYVKGWYPTGKGGKLQYWEGGQLKPPGTEAYRLLKRTAKDANQLLIKPVGMALNDVKAGLRDVPNIGRYSDKVENGKRLTIFEARNKGLLPKNTDSEHSLVGHLQRLAEGEVQPEPESNETVIDNGKVQNTVEVLSNLSNLFIKDKKADHKMTEWTTDQGVDDPAKVISGNENLQVAPGSDGAIMANTAAQNDWSPTHKNQDVAPLEGTGRGALAIQKKLMDAGHLQSELNALQQKTRDKKDALKVKPVKPKTVKPKKPKKGG